MKVARLSSLFPVLLHFLFPLLICFDAVAAASVRRAAGWQCRGSERFPGIKASWVGGQLSKGQKKRSVGSAKGSAFRGSVGNLQAFSETKKQGSEKNK